MRDVTKQTGQIENLPQMLEKNNELITKLMEDYAEFHKERRYADEMREEIAQSLYNLKLT